MNLYLFFLPMLPAASKYLLWGTALSDVANNARNKVLMWAEARKAAILPPPVKGVIKVNYIFFFSYIFLLNGKENRM